MQIKRIENPSYYEKYSIHRAHVAKKLGKMLSEVEKVLWHGTLEHLADIIANSKFDRGYAGARRKDGECLHSPFTDINQQIPLIF